MYYSRAEAVQSSRAAGSILAGQGPDPLTQGESTRRLDGVSLGDEGAAHTQDVPLKATQQCKLTAVSCPYTRGHFYPVPPKHTRPSAGDTQDVHRAPAPSHNVPHTNTPTVTPCTTEPQTHPRLCCSPHGHTHAKPQPPALIQLLLHRRHTEAGIA